MPLRGSPPFPLLSPTAGRGAVFDFGVSVLFHLSRSKDFDHGTSIFQRNTHRQQRQHRHFPPHLCADGRHSHAVQQPRPPRCVGGPKNDMAMLMTLNQNDQAITVLPPQPVANMRVGNMDGFCLGKPWNHRARAACGGQHRPGPVAAVHPHALGQRIPGWPRQRRRAHRGGKRPHPAGVLPRLQAPELKHAAVNLLKAEMPWQPMAMAGLPAAPTPSTGQSVRTLLQDQGFVLYLPCGDTGDADGDGNQPTQAAQAAQAATI